MFNCEQVVKLFKIRRGKGTYTEACVRWLPSLERGVSHSVTAQAMNRCQVLTWNVRVFEPFVRRFPALHRNATRLLSRRLRLAEGRLQELATELPIESPNPSTSSPGPWS